MTGPLAGPAVRAGEPPSHGAEPPSGWVLRWAHLAPPGASVLDVACGLGRHARWFAARGHAVTAIDRSAPALAGLAALPGGSAVRTVEADIEGDPWPLQGPDGVQRFGVVVVTRYLWRPLWPQLLASVAPGGLLIYETFSSSHASIGRPSRPEFLLRHGELLQACAALRIVAYEDGFLDAATCFVQRVAAVQVTESSGPPARHRLDPAGGGSAQAPG